MTPFRVMGDFMKTTTIAGATALAILLAACGDAATEAATPAAGDAPVVLAETLSRGDAEAPLGATRAEVERALGSGEAMAADNPDCPTGPAVAVTRADGLTLTFRDDRLIGWQSTDNELKTAEGVMVGMTRVEAQAAYGDRIAAVESTLGDEMAAGEVGFLVGGPDPDDRIDVIFHGDNCFAR